jgi:two-component system KDP operon response regulator KdpE
MRKITDIPVLIVSAISDKDAVIKGLEIGAEDYVTKPYHPLELVARIKKTLARSNGGAPRRQYEFSDIQLHINLDTNEVNLRGEMVYLPKKIFTLLALLGRNAPEMVSNEAIADELWGSDDETYLKRIKYLIFTLRKYIEVEPSEPKLVVTWGRFGYRLATGTPQKPEA